MTNPKKKKTMANKKKSLEVKLKEAEDALKLNPSSEELKKAVNDLKAKPCPAEEVKKTDSEELAELKAQNEALKAENKGLKAKPKAKKAAQVRALEDLSEEEKVIEHIFSHNFHRFTYLKNIQLGSERTKMKLKEKNLEELKGLEDFMSQQKGSKVKVSATVPFGSERVQVIKGYCVPIKVYEHLKKAEKRAGNDGYYID